MDIFRIINEGNRADSPGHNGAKMEAWGQKMPPVQVAELTAFIIATCKGRRKSRWIGAVGRSLFQAPAAVLAAAVRAIFHIIPNFSPLLAPGERPAATRANLARQIGLFDVFSHRGNILPIAP